MSQDIVVSVISPGECRP